MENWGHESNQERNVEAGELEEVTSVSPPLIPSWYQADDTSLGPQRASSTHHQLANSELFFLPQIKRLTSQQEGKFPRARLHRTATERAQEGMNDSVSQ